MARAKKILRLCSVRAMGTFCVLLAFTSLVSAQDSCASFSDCLSKSLKRQQETYLVEIETAWRQWQEIKPFRDQMIENNDQESLSEFETLFADSEQQFQRMHQIGNTIASQGFREILLTESAAATSDRNAASQRLQRLTASFRAFLKADQTGIGDTRARLMREIDGFRVEHARLEQNLYQSGIGLALSATAFAADLKLEQSPILSQAARGWLRTYEQLATRIPHTIDAKNLSEAQLSGDERAMAMTAAGAIARETSNFIGLLKLAGVPAAIRMSSVLGPVGLAADVTIFVADSAHFALAISQSNDAHDRLDRLEADEQLWRGRIYVQGQKVRLQAERLARANDALSGQARIAALMQRINNGGRE